MSLRLSMIADGPESIEMILAFNETVPLRDGASFGPVTCKADCNPPCHFQWKKVTRDGNITNIINEAILPKQVVHDKGVLKYCCVVTGFYANSYGSKSVSRELTLNIRCTLFTYISSVIVSENLTKLYLADVYLFICLKTLLYILYFAKFKKTVK